MSRKVLPLLGLLMLTVAGLLEILLPSAGLSFAKRKGGWGIDACLSAHIPGPEVPAFLKLVESSQVSWLRERDIGKTISETSKGETSERLAVWRQEKSRGFRVLAFGASLPGIEVEDSGNQLPENLLDVFKQARRLARVASGTVDAWEMCNEPETFYMRDLPDRVVAYQKAVYLGLKSGGRRSDAKRRLPGSSPTLPSPAVLMGALAYPPGPWLDAAARNGLYEYTDAINFHHYGFCDSLTGVIAAQRAFAGLWTRGRALPLWLTEVGLNNVPYADREAATARRGQAEYLLSCASQAMACRLAVFMPFILVHRDDPFEMVPVPEKPRPSWTAYRDFTRNHQLSFEPIVNPPHAPDTVVLQWLPDGIDGGLPSKISRSYWFERSEDRRGWNPIKGRIHLYNLGATPVRVRVVFPLGKDFLSIKGEAAAVVDLPPYSQKNWAVTFEALTPNYLRQSLHFEAQTLDSRDRIVKRSPLVFTLETMPLPDLPHHVAKLDLSACGLDSTGKPRFAYVSGGEPYTVSNDGGVWLGINGVTVVRKDGDEVTFDVMDANKDPLSPPMAVAALPKGLPVLKRGFLDVSAVDASGAPASVRIDLIDQFGQRFSVVENLGRNPFVESNASVLLSYEDFHPWVFGRCVPGKDKLEPRRIREIQIRFYGAGKGRLYRMKLTAIGFDDASVKAPVPGFRQN